MLFFSNNGKNDASKIFKSLPQRPVCNLVSAEERTFICGLLIFSALLSYMSVKNPHPIPYHFITPTTKQSSFVKQPA